MNNRIKKAKVKPRRRAVVKLSNQQPKQSQQPQKQDISVTKVAGGLKKPKYKSDYIQAILSLPHNGMLPHFPLYNYTVAHVCKRKVTTNYPVNASGNLYLEFTPSLLSKFSSSSSVSPIIAINNVDYTSVVNPITFAAVTGFVDVSSLGGLCLDAASFHNAIVTGFHVKLSATGVSTMNRSGYINLIESIDDSSLQLSNAGAAGTMTGYMAGRTLPNAILSNMTLERDLATAYSNSFEYRFIPNFNSNTISGYDFDVVTQNTLLLIDEAVDFKKLCVYVSGAHPSTIIRAEITVMYQALPRQAKLSEFPPTYGNDYTDITVPLQMLSHNRDLILKEVTGGSVGYVGATSTNQGIVVRPIASN